MTGTARIIRGNALALPLADATVDLCVTSPPYWSLRSYSDNGEHYPGQIGDEATPGEFVDALIAATAEMARVLKPTGSAFINLGDKYMATSFSPQKRGKDASGVKRPTVTRECERCGVEFTGGPGRRFCSSFCGGSDNSRKRQRGGIREKSLIGLPWRYALRCIDELGLTLRAEIVLDKKNGLPESVTDRVRRSHEQVFHFVKQPRYYSAVDEIRETYSERLEQRHRTGRPPAAPTGAYSTATRNDADQHRGQFGFSIELNPLGKLPGSVWEYVSQPFQAPPHLGVDHYAPFNMALPRRIITGWSPPGICTACGEGRRPVAAIGGLIPSRAGAHALGGAGHKYAGRDDGGSYIRTSSGPSFAKRERTITGYACACPDTTAPTTPSVVLDPFMGTGTTLLVAKALGRTGIGTDMSGDYCRLAQWRTNDPGQLAAAMQLPKPPAENNGQGDLFSEASA